MATESIHIIFWRPIVSDFNPVLDGLLLLLAMGLGEEEDGTTMVAVRFRRLQCTLIVALASRELLMISMERKALLSHAQHG